MNINDLIKSRKTQAKEIIKLLELSTQNTKRVKLRKHCPYATYLADNTNNKKMTLDNNCLTFNYNNGKDDIFLSTKSGSKYFSYSLDNKMPVHHKEYIISKLKEYIVRCDFYMKYNLNVSHDLQIKEELYENITEEFKKKCDPKNKIETNVVYLLNIIPFASFIKQNDSVKIATSYAIYESHNKLNIMFENMFSYKNHFKSFNSKDELYNDIRSFNIGNENVTVNNFTHICKNIGAISHGGATKLPDGTIIEEKYTGIDKPCKFTAHKPDTID